MRIVMLGHSGVGKTTYMACMYATMLDPEGGFSIRATREADHNSFVRIATSVVNEGTYPAFTAFRSEYEFVLLYQEVPVLPFTWIDRRGNSLNESSSSTGSSELIDDLKSADAILAFFDSNALSDARGRRNRDVGRLISVLTSAIAECDHLLPIGLVLTKFDQIDETKSDPVKPLRGLIEAIQSSKIIHGALVPTACGHRCLINIPLPVLFVLHIGIRGRLARLSSEIDMRVSRAQGYREKAGFWDWVDSRLSGVATYGELAKQEMQSAQQEAEIHNSLVEHANALAPLLEEILQF